MTIIMVKRKFQGSLVLFLLLFSGCELFDADEGQATRFAFFSQALSQLSSVLVYSPEDFGSTTPVIYLLNGWGASSSTWGDNMDLRAEAQERSLIFVSLTAGVNPYINDTTHADENYEDYVLEVVAEVESEFALDLESDGRALCGISNGGGGAIYLFSRHSERFAACGVLSGSYYPQEHHLSGLPNHRIRIDIGLTDGLLRDMRSLHSDLEAADVEHQYFEHEGRHDWDFWKRYAPEQFDFLESMLEH